MAASARWGTSRQEWQFASTVMVQHILSVVAVVAAALSILDGEEKALLPWLRHALSQGGRA